MSHPVFFILQYVETARENKKAFFFFFFPPLSSPYCQIIWADTYCTYVFVVRGSLGKSWEGGCRKCVARWERQTHTRSIFTLKVKEKKKSCIELSLQCAANKFGIFFYKIAWRPAFRECGSDVRRGGNTADFDSALLSLQTAWSRPKSTCEVMEVLKERKAKVFHHQRPLFSCTECLVGMLNF